MTDSTGGGGWGPVGTPAILAGGRLEPRKTIGSIDTSEFLVGLGSAGVDFSWALALLIGGVVAAPIAAWLVRHIPPRGDLPRVAAAPAHSIRQYRADRVRDRAESVHSGQ